MFWYLLGAALLLLTFLVIVPKFTYWSRRGIPQYTLWKILINNLVKFVRQSSITDTLQETYKDFTDHRCMGTYQFGTPRLCVNDPDLIKNILVRDFDHFVDHTSFMSVEGDPIFEKVLFVLSGEEWRQMRTIATPNFTSSKMKFMFQLMVDCVEQFMRYFAQHDSEILTFEMKDLFGRISHDVSASTNFGVASDSLSDRKNEMYLMTQRGFHFNNFWFKLKFLLIYMAPQVTKVLGLKLINQKAMGYFRELVDNNIRHRQRNGIVRPDFIQLLMKTNGKVGADFDVGLENGKAFSFTDEHRVALVISLFGGGFDTISTLLSFAAYELALQPNIQQRLQSEIDSTMRHCEGSITYEALQGLKYFDQVISETLRKWPIGFFLDRRCVKPYTIDPIKPGEVPVHLDKGDSVWIPMFALHRNPKFFPDPDRFDPDRFDEANKADRHPYTYLPFGAGPRQCVGTRFAFLEAKLVLFSILSKYDFVVVDKTSIPLKLEQQYVQLVPKDGFWLGLKCRPTLL